MNTPTVVIIGASKGIGRHTAQRFLADGASVIGTSRTDAGRTALEAAAGPHADRLSTLLLDVRDDDSVARFAGAVAKLTDAVDVLVCNAGVMIESDTLLEQEVDDWRTVLEVNLTGPFQIIRALWASLVAAEVPRVITVSGGLGNVHDGMEGGGCVAYRVSKCGIAALTMTVAEEGADAGLLACGYDPEWVRTDLGGDDAPKDPSVCGAELAALADRMSRDKLTGVLVRAGETVPW